MSPSFEFVLHFVRCDRDMVTVSPNQIIIIIIIIEFTIFQQSLFKFCNSILFNIRWRFLMM